MKPAIILAALVLFAVPTQACHRFARWNYPYPQRCSSHPVAAPVADKNWYVEIVLPPELTQDAKDLAEHNAAVAAHKDELNQLLDQLHQLTQEGNQEPDK